jgi:hypothetical protein
MENVKQIITLKASWMTKSSTAGTGMYVYGTHSMWGVPTHASRNTA